MNKAINDIISIISRGKFDLTSEKTTQQEIHKVLISGNPGHAPFIFVRHYRFDKNNIPDFFDQQFGIAIEVKIKGTKAAIYKQCERYCKIEQVKALILCTNKSMGFPAELNGKPCYYINLGKAWL